MMNIDIERLKHDLRRDEGIELFPYEDTEGITTIGVGRNLQDVGITKEEAFMMLENDIKAVIVQIQLMLPWAKDLNEPRKRALVNMGFNLGVGGLLKFKKMLKNLEEKRWKWAAFQALDSKWADQVGDRAKRIAKILETGEEDDATL